MTTITVLLYFLLLSLPSPFAISEEEKYSTTCSVTLIIVGQTISRNWTAMLLNGLRRKSRVSSGNYASALLTPWPSMPPSIFIRERKIILPFSPNFPLAPTCANFPRDYPRLVVDEAGYPGSRIINHAFYDSCLMRYSRSSYGTEFFSRRSREIVGRIAVDIVIVDQRSSS